MTEVAVAAKLLEVLEADPLASAHAAPVVEHLLEHVDATGEPSEPGAWLHALELAVEEVEAMQQDGRWPSTPRREPPEE